MGNEYGRRGRDRDEYGRDTGRDEYGRDTSAASSNRGDRVGKTTLTQQIARKASGSRRPDGDAANRAEDGFAGAPREVPYRAEMERAFGESFGNVAAHTGVEAQDAATDLGARAYTVGESIAFRDPSPDRELVAHELTHVVQQRGGRDQGAMLKAEISAPTDAAEQEADRVASTVAAGGNVAGTIGRDDPAPISRKADEKPKEKPKGGKTFEWAYERLGFAYQATLRNKDMSKATEIIGEVVDWLQDVASGKDLQDKFGGHVGTIDQATALVGFAITNVRTTWRILKMGHKPSRGQWQLTLNGMKAAKPWLVTLTDEVAFKDNEILTGLEDATQDAYTVHAVIAALPAALAIGAYAGPIIATEFSLMGGQAVIGFVLANPVVATELGLFAVGMALTIAMSGGLEEYLAQWETGEGKRQIAQDVIVVLQVATMRGGGAPRDSSADPPSKPAPSGRVRVQAHVDEMEGGELRATITDVDDAPDTAAPNTHATSADASPPAKGGAGAPAKPTKTRERGERIDPESIPDVDKPLPTSPEEAAILKQGGVEWTNLEARSYYLKEEVRIGQLNEHWIKEGVSLRDRAYRSWEMRKNARVTARAMMPDPEQVEKLRQDDIKLYGTPDGPTWEWSQDYARREGHEGDAVYQFIIDGAQRSRASVNRDLGIKPKNKSNDGTSGDGK